MTTRFVDLVRQNAKALKDYWQHGVGAAKIRWHQKGSFRRCQRHLRKYLKNPDLVNRTCAQWHHDVTGKWPAEKH